jgi:hypothetical protein
MMRRSEVIAATKSSAKLKIHLENDQLIMYGPTTESSGCVLRGALSLKLSKATRFKSLILCFHGTISVSWNQREFNDVHFLFLLLLLIRL